MPDREYSGSAAELAAIDALPDDDAQVEPDDGQLQLDSTDEATDAEEVDTGQYLSPEERVAESVRQDLEERGEDADEDDEDDEEDDEEETDRERELRFLREYYRDKEEETQSLAERSDDARIRREHDAEHWQIVRRFEQALVTAQEEVIQQSMNSSSPETYRAQHMPAAVAANRRERDIAIAENVARANAELEASKQRHQRPRFLLYLIQANDLPNNERIRAEIDEEVTVEGMAKRAAFLGRVRKQLMQQATATKQERAEEAAKQIRRNAVHAADTGRPRRSKEVSYAGTARELAAIEALPD